MYEDNKDQIEDTTLDGVETTETLDTTGELTDKPTLDTTETAPEKPKHTIKYNGEEKELSLEELKIAAQKGLNYDHVYGKLEETKTSSKKAEAELTRLTSVLKNFGYSGSAQEIADILEAQQREVEPEQVKKERETREADESEKFALKERMEILESQLTERRMADDLAAIKKLDPSVKGFADVPEKFFSLIKTGQVDAVTAFKVVKSEIEANNPSMGDINSTEPTEKNEYTRDEVAKMSQAEVEKNYDKIRKSMSKWR